MTSRRIYLWGELEGLAAMLSDALKDRQIFKAQEKDLIGAHPWLASLMLQIDHNWENFIRHGGGKANMTEENFLEITLPRACTWNHGESMWGVNVPCYYAFERIGNNYRIKGSKTPYDTYLEDRRVAQEEEKDLGTRGC